MAGQGFLARVGGFTKQIFGIQASAGAADAGKIPALDSTGKIDSSMMPTGIGANTVVATTTEALSAGAFVNLYDAGGAISARLADNTNGREAWGYVNLAYAIGDPATVQRMNTVNGQLSGLTPGAEYWLGTAGGFVTPALDAVADTGKLDQFLGIAISGTELATEPFDSITL